MRTGMDILPFLIFNLFIYLLSSLVHLDSDEYVKKNVATLIREIAKHTPEVSGFDVTCSVKCEDHLILYNFYS